MFDGKGFALLCQELGSASAPALPTEPGQPPSSAMQEPPGKNHQHLQKQANPLDLNQILYCSQMLIFPLPVCPLGRSDSLSMASLGLPQRTRPVPVTVSSIADDGDAETQAAMGMCRGERSCIASDSSMVGDVWTSLGKERCSPAFHPSSVPCGFTPGRGNGCSPAGTAHSSPHVPSLAGHRSSP